MKEGESQTVHRSSFVFFAQYLCKQPITTVPITFVAVLFDITLLISIMDGVQNLPPHLQGELMKNLEQMQMKDSLT